MAEKTIKTRFQMKRGTSAEWALATGFKPLEGESIFYSDLNKIKVGRYKDGTTAEQKKSANHQDYLMLLSEIPFSDAQDADTLDGKHASEFALSSHGTHVTSETVRTALGTGTGTTKYLREDGTWVVPPDTKDGNDNQKVKTGNVTFGVNDVIDFEAGSNVSISGDAANKKITISATDEATLTVTDKANTDTTDLIYAVTNIAESGTKGHTLTPTYTGLPTKAYVDKIATGHVKYLGTVTALTGLSTTAGAGDFYRVQTAFAFGSETAHVGDIFIATKDNPAQNTTDWDLIHTEVDSNTWVENKVNAAGYVTAPTASNANKVWKTDSSGNPGWRDDANVDTGATSVEVTGTGNAVTTATYNASTRKLTLTKGATYTTKTEIDALISSGTADPSASTTSQYYFKYN